MDDIKPVAWMYESKAPWMATPALFLRHYVVGENFAAWCPSAQRLFLESDLDAVCAERNQAFLSAREWATRAGEQEGRADRSEAEVVRLRELASTIYAGLGGECNLPEAWLDMLLAASEGREFSLDGLLPFRSEPRYTITEAGREMLEANRG